VLWAPRRRVSGRWLRNLLPRFLLHSAGQEKGSPSYTTFWGLTSLDRMFDTPTGYFSSSAVDNYLVRLDKFNVTSHSPPVSVFSISFQ